MSSIDAVSFLPAQAMPSLEASAGASPEPGFSRWFESQLGGLNDELQQAERGVQALAVGAAPNLHEVMMKLEQAKLSLQLMVQVRNHLLDAYQDVIRMQI
jgi:flagellar hook-basal body complex protein FliE